MSRHLICAALTICICLFKVSIVAVPRRNLKKKITHTKKNKKNKKQKNKKTEKQKKNKQTTEKNNNKNKTKTNKQKRKKTKEKKEEIIIWLKQYVIIVSLSLL